VNHDEIKRWVEQRGGRPAVLGAVGRGGRATGLRIDFPEYRIKAALKRITWDEFFAAFDAAGYGFAYQDEAAPGQLSRFYRFVRRAGCDLAGSRVARA
jgi:hypothetical protein